MNKLYFLILFLCFHSVQADEKIFSNKTLSNLYMNPSDNAPIIYPVELGKLMFVEDSNEVWFKVLDKRTGLMGWVLKENYSSEKPIQKGEIKDYEKSFNVFKEKVLEMSKAIRDAISIETFKDVEHLGGAAAAVIADNEWFEGRRHANQAFQVYEIWKGENQSPSFLSFRDENSKERFIILSGPHRPRYLKSNKSD